MTDYAKLATFGFRFFAVAALLHSIPGIVSIIGLRRMEVGALHIMVWPLVAAFLYPAIATIVFINARPLGEMVARDLE